MIADRSSPPLSSLILSRFGFREGRAFFIPNLGMHSLIMASGFPSSCQEFEVSKRIRETEGDIDYLNSLQNPALDPVYNARQSRYVLARNF